MGAGCVSSIKATSKSCSAVIRTDCNWLDPGRFIVTSELVGTIIAVLLTKSLACADKP